jgi:SAM-dependent methyltransferase
MSGYTPQTFGDRARGAIGARGARAVTGDLARWASAGVAGAPWTLRGAHGSFELDGERYRYLHQRYKLSWLTERAVEVPVVQAIVDGHRGRRILEVGHVLGHYRHNEHTVVDKYEQAPGVLNLDVLELGELGPFDLIVAISTLEHVGLDEAERDPGKAPRAVEALKQRLAPGGRLVITIPAGYNRDFDRAFTDGTIETSSLSALRRVPGRSGWRETSPAEAFAAPYDFLLYRARAVVFAFISRASG